MLAAGTSLERPYVSSQGSFVAWSVVGGPLDFGTGPLSANQDDFALVSFPGTP